MVVSEIEKMTVEGYALWADKKIKSLETKLKEMTYNYQGAMSDCDHYEDVIKELETKLQTATEALEHYASENNWAHSNFDERGFYADEYMVYRHGYLKAREALRVIRGEE